MYDNLRAEMARLRVTNGALAEAIGVDPATMSQKLNQPDRLKLCEAKKIQARFFPTCTLDYLFGKTAEDNEE